MQAIADVKARVEVARCVDQGRCRIGKSTARFGAAKCGKLDIAASHHSLPLVAPLRTARQYSLS
jgi:hypothetical protein